MEDGAERSEGSMHREGRSCTSFDQNSNKENFSGQSGTMGRFKDINILERLAPAHERSVFFNTKVKKTSTVNTTV